MTFIPSVTYNKDGKSEYRADIFSRLLENGIIFLTGVVDSNMASVFMAQMRYLRSDIRAKNIVIYINSPGGCVYSCTAIVDTIRMAIDNDIDVKTICTGLAASAGSMILASGKLMHRYAFRNSYIMIHQPSGGTRGTSSDIRIYSDHVEAVKLRFAHLYSVFSGYKISVGEYLKYIDRDNYLTPEQAVELGIVDYILD